MATRLAVGCVAILISATATARLLYADTVIATDQTQVGGTFAISPPTLVITDATSAPLLTLSAGAATTGVEAVIVGNLAGETGFLRIEQASLLSNFAVGGQSSAGTYGAQDVLTGNAHLGLNAGSNGQATVTGDGSRWENSDALIVGFDGAGELTVEAGGAVVNSNGYIGIRSGSQGTVTVTGEGSTWTNHGNLFLGAPSGIPSTAALNLLAGGLVTVTGVTTPLAGSTLTVDGGTLRTQSLDLRNGTFLHQDGAVQINGGTLTHNGPALVVSGSETGKSPSLQFLNGAGRASSANYAIIVGNLADESGQLRIEGGSVLTGSSGPGFSIGTFGARQVTSGSGYLGLNVGSSGEAIVTGAGSRWENSFNLYVGHDGTGKLTVADCGHVSANTLFASLPNLLGDGVITARGLVLDGHDLHFDSTHGLQQTLPFGAGGQLLLDMNGTASLGAGHKGIGALRIADGLAISSFSGYLGYRSGSQGTATVTGEGSSWTNTNFDLYVGAEGSGELLIESGGLVANPVGRIGSASGSQGSVTVTGNGSRWSNSSSLFVGESGAGELAIANGGEVTNTTGSIARLNGSAGSVDVTGDDSRWTNSGPLYVGEAGTGELTIAAGGMVANTTGYLGGSLNAQGAALVTGEGSTWTNGGELFVGRFGAGQLTIASGGVVHNTTAHVGSSGIFSQGAVTVTGTGSTWNNNGDLFLGMSNFASGTSRLDILAGGLVTVAGATLTRAVGTLNVDGGTLRTQSLDVTNGNFQHHRGVVQIDGGTYAQSGVVLAVSGNGAGKDASLQLLNGAGHAANAFKVFIVGSQAGETGRLRIEGGSTLINNNFFPGEVPVGSYGGSVIYEGHAYLGLNKGSTGDARITGSDSLWRAMRFYIGHSGAGELVIENSAAANSFNGIVGFAAGSQGAVTVTGNGSTWSNASDLAIGVEGVGHLKIEAGGKVTNTFARLGISSGSQGTAIITGGGSTWINSDSLFVGVDGSGALTVADGGSVTAHSLLAAHGDLFGNGNISVRGLLLDGHDLTFDSTRGLQQTISFGTGGQLMLNADGTGLLGAGYRGAGTLRIADGVNVSSIRGFLGFQEGSQGTATVTGNGSTWNNAGNLILGGTSINDATGSIGSLTISEGGSVSVGGELRVHEGGAVNVKADGQLSAQQLVSTGSLLMELAGAVSANEFDRLVVNGHAVLAGMLQLDETDDFSASNNDAMTLLRYGDRTGIFHSVTGDGADWSIHYGPTTATALVHAWQASGIELAGDFVVPAGVEAIVQQDWTWNGLLVKRGDGTLVLDTDDGFTAGPQAALAILGGSLRLEATTSRTIELAGLTFGDLGQLANDPALVGVAGWYANVQSVPEPNATALALVAAASFLLHWRRRRANRA